MHFIYFLFHFIGFSLRFLDFIFIFLNTEFNQLDPAAPVIVDLIGWIQHHLLFTDFKGCQRLNGDGQIMRSWAWWRGRNPVQLALWKHTQTKRMELFYGRKCWIHICCTIGRERQKTLVLFTEKKRVGFFYYYEAIFSPVSNWFFFFLFNTSLFSVCVL